MNLSHSRTVLASSFAQAAATHETLPPQILRLAPSAFSTGLFGGMWAYQNTFVDPDIAFVEVRTIDAIMGTMLGDLGTIVGPVIGMSALYWLREIIWVNFLDYHLIVQGLLLGAIVLYLPRGLMGLSHPASPLMRWLRKDEPSSPFDKFEGDSRELTESASVNGGNLEASDQSNAVSPTTEAHP